MCDPKTQPQRPPLWGPRRCAQSWGGCAHPCAPQAHQDGRLPTVVCRISSRSNLRATKGRPARPHTSWGPQGTRRGGQHTATVSPGGIVW